MKTRKYILILLGICAFAFQSSAQTKKIASASASHALSDPFRNETISDNLGAIMDYERFNNEEFKPKIDTNTLISVDTLAVEQPQPVDTAVYEEVSRNSTLVIDEATPEPGSGKVKSQPSSTAEKDTKKRKKKRKKRKHGKKVSMLKTEIDSSDRPGIAQKTQAADMSWLSLFLLIPIGLLVFKKS